MLELNVGLPGAEGWHVKGVGALCHFATSPALSFAFRYDRPCSPDEERDFQAAWVLPWTMPNPSRSTG